MDKQILVLSLIFSTFLFSCGAPSTTTTTGGSSGGSQRIKSVTTYTGNIYVSNSIGDKIFHSLVKSAYASGTADRKHTAEFDAEGKKVARVNSHIGVNLEMYWTYEYHTSGNGNGKVKKKISFDNLDNQLDTKDITYNADGTISEVVWNAGIPALEMHINYTYDVNGNMTKWVDTDASGKIYEYMFYYYDGSNRKIKREHYWRITVDVEYQMEWQDLTYDSNDNIIKIDYTKSKDHFDKTGAVSIVNAEPLAGFNGSREFTFNTNEEVTVNIKKDKSNAVESTKSYGYEKEKGEDIGNWYEIFMKEDALDE